MTLFNTGVPAFLLSLEPNTRKQKQEFFRKILTNAGPAAFTAFITIAVLSLFGEKNGIPSVSLGMIAMYLLAIAAFLLLVHISRPMNTYRSIIVQLMFLGFILFLLIPITRDLYMISDINAYEVKVLACFAIAELIVIKLLIFGLEHIRKRKRVDELKEIGRWKE